MSLGLGDLFFAIPAIKAVKENFSDESVTLVTNAQSAEFAVFIPEIDEVLAYEKKNLFKLVRLIQHENFARVFVFNPILKGGILAKLANIPVRVGYERDFERKQTCYGFTKTLYTHAYLPEEKKMHEAERYLDLLVRHGLTVQKNSLTPRLQLPEEWRQFGEDYIASQKGERKGPSVLINLGAAWEMRRWPAKRWAKVADWLIQNYDALVIFVGGQSEIDFLKQIQEKMNYPAVSAVGKLSLIELASVLSVTRLFLTHDTGALHLASILQVETIALFGPGDIQKVRPMSPKTRVIQHKMPCAPCKFQYTQKCQSNLCMQEIFVPEIRDAVMRELGIGSGLLDVSTYDGLEIQKKKILYLQSTSEVGGSDITLLRTIQALDQNKYEPHLLVPSEGPLIPQFREVGCRVHVMPEMRKLTRRRGLGYFVLYVFGYLPAVLKIVGVIRKEKIDLIHTNVIHNLYGFLAAFLAAKPHVWHIREIVVQSRLVKNIETFLVKAFSKKFLVMSNAIAEPFLGKNKGFPSNVTKLYDGIDLNKFSAERSGERIRKELGIAPDDFVVGIVCRLDPWKGLDLFVEAAAKVHQVEKRIKFLVCGGEIEGHEGYEARLKKKAADLGLGTAMIFSGWKYQVDDTPEVYRALNVSVQCPVHPEPYGLTNIEAMACQIPIVTFNRGGAAEVCQNHKTAILVPADDVEAIAEGILTIYDDPKLAVEMGLAGRKRSEDLFNFRKCTRRLEEIYEEIFGE